MLSLNSSSNIEGFVDVDTKTTYSRKTLNLRFSNLVGLSERKLLITACEALEIA